MKIKAYDTTGKQTTEVALSKNVFGLTPNQELLNQAIRVYRSNQRVASAKVKTRSQINRTTAKAFRQKGTGNARHGSKRANIFVGGYKAHGPQVNTNYKLTLPKKMKIAAIKSALSLYASEKRINAIEGLSKIAQPKTSDMVKLISQISSPKDSHKLTIVLTKEQTNAFKSIRNIVDVTCTTADNLTTYQVLKNKHLVFATEAIKAITERLK